MESVPEAADQAALSFDAVSYSYGDAAILQKVSLIIHRREFVGIIGPNGGGKTTLLKLAMGLLTPSQGCIRLFGIAPKDAILKVGYVPQAVHFDRQFPISVEELVLGGRLSQLPWYGRFSRSDRIAARRALERVGMLEYAHRPLSALSGGQAQRALFARALATPKLELLLLDEPTTNIDSKGEEDIYALLQQLRNEVTMVMVTHNLQTAISYFDRVICVHRHVAALSPEQVCEHFALGLYHSPLTGALDI